MSDLFDEQKLIAAKYVHATSRGHEAIQCATRMYSYCPAIGLAHTTAMMPC